MGQIIVKAAATLNARAADIYATIADYQHGHPNILPKKHLYDLQVEQGGYGKRLLVPLIQPPVYRKELTLLEAVAQQRSLKL